MKTDIFHLITLVLSKFPDEQKVLKSIQNMNSGRAYEQFSCCDINNTFIIIDCE